MALISKEFDLFFVSTVKALKPYLNDVIITGGCANALYRFAPEADPGPIPLATFDVDVAVPHNLPGCDISLNETLKKQNLLLPSRERTNKYIAGENDKLKLEFLCPRTGLSTKIKQQKPALVDIQPGLTAEALDFLEIIYEDTPSIDLLDINELKVDESLVVRVPHPLRYVLQKTLIRDRRKNSVDKRKDSYYIYEITVLFRHHLNELASDLGKRKKPISGKRLDRAISVLQNQFAHDSAEGVTDVITMARESRQAISEKAVLKATYTLIKALQKARSNSP